MTCIEYRKTKNMERHAMLLSSIAKATVDSDYTVLVCKYLDLVVVSDQNIYRHLVAVTIGNTST